MEPGPSSLPVPPPPATALEKSAWIAMGGLLLFFLEYHLVPALLAGLFVYSIVHTAAGRLSGRFLSHHRAKLVVVSLIALGVIAAAAALVILLAAFLKGKLGHLPRLLDHMAAVIESARERLGLTRLIPAAEELKTSLAAALRDHAREIQHAGGEAGRMLLHALAGLVIGALATFDQRRPAAPLAVTLAERLRRLLDAFEKVVFAQVKISAVNSALTGLFLLVALPLFGVELPLRKTLVVITFIIGLIPVLGNLVSNTAIVVVALGTSLPAAIASLTFLVVIHKLEYLLNARIVGGHIQASAWEILLAMLCFEVAFGVPGVVLAPIVYAYGKRELADRGLI
jgi:predicted PurR-regulated permease PerM